MRVIHRPSPNHSDRNGVVVDTIVIHSTAGSLEGSLAWLCNPVSKVSAHYVLARDGRVFKLVPLSRAAWHAGYCPGFANANRRSIGIELEQLPDQHPTQEQLDVLMRLISLIRRHFSIRHIVGHSEINPRKRDPFAIDMKELRKAHGLA